MQKGDTTEVDILRTKVADLERVLVGLRAEVAALRESLMAKPAHPPKADDTHETTLSKRGDMVCETTTDSCPLCGGFSLWGYHPEVCGECYMDLYRPQERRTNQRIVGPERDGPLDVEVEKSKLLTTTKTLWYM